VRPPVYDLIVFHSNPFFGAKKNVMMNIIVSTNTMTTPDGKLNVTLKNRPITDDTIPINAEVKIIVDNLLVNK